MSSRLILTLLSLSYSFTGLSMQMNASSMTKSCFYALKNRDAKLLEKLLNNGADPNLRETVTYFNKTLLMQAIAGDETAVLESMRLPVEDHRTDIIRLLARHPKTNVNAQDHLNGNSLISWALWYNSPVAIEELLNRPDIILNNRDIASGKLSDSAKIRALFAKYCQKISAPR